MVHVRGLRTLLALFLLGGTVCGCTLPRVDLPGTAFNEADAPINLAPPVPQSIRVGSPPVARIVVLPTLPVYYSLGKIVSLALESAAAPRQRYQHSLQDLLCTLLI